MATNFTSIDQLFDVFRTIDALPIEVRRGVTHTAVRDALVVRLDISDARIGRVVVRVVDAPITPESAIALIAGMRQEMHQQARRTSRIRASDRELGAE